MRRLAAAALLASGILPAQVTRTETQSVLVDVLVTDKKGVAVAGLTERDFQVFEDGKEQAVDGLFTEKGASTGPANHSLILLFDNAGMTSREQAWARQIGIQLLDHFATSNTNTAVLDFGGTLRVSQTFTNDITRAKQALARPASSAMSGDSGVPANAMNDFAVRDLLRSLDGLAKNLQGAQGRKSVVFFSPGYSLTGEYNRRLDEVVGAANRANVSFYPVNTRLVAASGSAMLDVSTPAQPSGRGRGFGGTTTLTGTPTGMAAANAGLDSAQVPSGPALLGFLLRLADATGGFVVRQPDDSASLSRISREQGEFYVLSYTPPDSPDGSCHKLRVKVKRDGVNLRAREGYCKRTPGALLSGSPSEKALESKALAAQNGNIAATMQVPYFYKATNVARVAAVLEVQTAKVAFKKDKNRFAAQLDVLGIATQEDGSAAARFSDIVKLEFDTQAQVDQFKRTPYRYENQFDIAPGKYKLAIALTAGSESFAKLEAPLEIEPYTVGEFSLSGLALSREFRPANASASGLDEFLIDERKKLISEGAEIIPSGTSRLNAAGPAGVFFEIYEPLLAKPDPSTPLAVAFQMRVLTRGDGQVKADTGAMRIDLSGKEGQPALPLGLNLPVKGLSPGAYTLEVVALDSVGRSAKRSVAFEIE